MYAQSFNTGAPLNARPEPLSRFLVDDLLPGAGLFGHGRPLLREKEVCLNVILLHFGASMERSTSSCTSGTYIHPEENSYSRSFIAHLE